MIILTKHRQDIEIFKELKMCYTSDEGLKRRDAIINQIKNAESKCSLYNEEKMYDKLLEIVLKYPNIYLMEKYFNELRIIYPKEMLNKYKEVIDEKLLYNSNRAVYTEVVNMLVAMTYLEGGKERVNNIINEWKITFKNKRALHEEINKVF